MTNSKMAVCLVKTHTRLEIRVLPVFSIGSFRLMVSSCEQQILRCSLGIRDMFHVYLNRFEFHFLWLHIIKTSKFCFFMHNGLVPGIAK